jgi:RimJ/RimL family protein N-acetyltransferase
LFEAFASVQSLSVKPETRAVAPPFQITTERLTLRPPAGADAPEMAAIFGDLRVMSAIGRDRVETTEEIRDRALRHERFFRELGSCIYLCRRRDTGRLVGDCGVVPAEGKGPEIEIAWRFAPAHWGRGYATEAARGVFDDAYARTTLDEIIAITLPENERSQRVATKLGMIERGAETWYGKTCRVYLMTRDAWLSGSPPAARAARSS